MIINNQTASQNIAAYKENIKDDFFIDSKYLESIMNDVYERGIISNELYARMKILQNKTFRTTQNGESQHSISSFDATGMLSSREAFLLIDSLYNTYHHSNTDLSKTNLNDFLVPNIIADVEAENKYKKLEYLNISGAKGIIKQGQRIVDSPTI